MVSVGLCGFAFVIFAVARALDDSGKYDLRSNSRHGSTPMVRFSLSNVNFKLADAVDTDVEFKYFKDHRTRSPKILTAKTVKDEHMNKKVPTTYLFHGYTRDDTDPWYKPLKHQLFLQGSHNVVYINWSKAGNKSYDVSAANINPVGKSIAKFIDASGVPLRKVHLVGHSLGAQLAGFVGQWVFRLTGKKIGRITGLDPAGPRFDYPAAHPLNRLSKDDAEFVDIVHTDIQGYGYTPPMGHVDFYPNGGKDQPGCPVAHVNVRCHHARAAILYIESFKSTVQAKQAEYIEDKHFKVTIKPRKKPKLVTFGHQVETSARGVYYFRTNIKHPFLKL